MIAIVFNSIYFKGLENYESSHCRGSGTISQAVIDELSPKHEIITRLLPI